MLFTLLLPACGPDPLVGADFVLTVQPLSAVGQDPWVGVDTVKLVIEQSDGTLDDFDLEPTGSTTLSGLPPLVEARLAVEGRAGGELVAFGRTSPVTLAGGDGNLRVLVARVGEVAALARVTTPGPVLGAGVAATGDGRFLLLGGVGASEGTGYLAEASDAVQVLDLGNPPESLAFTSTTQNLPPYGEAPPSTGRAGLSATGLTGADDLAGKVLLAGGAPRWSAPDRATGTAHLYDVDTGAFTDLGALAFSRQGHLAVEDNEGNVVFIGGQGPDGVVTEVERFDRARRTLVRLGEMEGSGVGGAAERLGTQGVLHCGGAVDLGDGTWITSDACTLVTPGGALEALPALPRPLAWHTMTQVAPEKVLVVGGVTVEPGAPISTVDGTALARTSAYLYDHAQRQWFIIEVTSLPRARHVALPNQDGGVLVMGGITEAGYGSDGPSAVTLACAERYDPVRQEFTLLDTCDEGEEVGSLGRRMQQMAWATDALHGTVVVGGTDGDAPLDAVLYWPPLPPDR